VAEKLAIESPVCLCRAAVADDFGLPLSVYRPSSLAVVRRVVGERGSISEVTPTRPGSPPESAVGRTIRSVRVSDGSYAYDSAGVRLVLGPVGCSRRQVEPTARGEGPPSSPSTATQLSRCSAGVAG
jgi:hypothetical protein